MCKVIIYNPTENVDIPDITLVISEKIKDEIPSINFIKRVKRKSSSNYNHTIELPQYIANNIIDP